MVTEAERLAVSTALEHVTAARDQLSAIDRISLQELDRIHLQEGETALWLLWELLNRRRSAAAAEMAKNGGAL